MTAMPGSAPKTLTFRVKNFDGGAQVCHCFQGRKPVLTAGAHPPRWLRFCGLLWREAPQCWREKPGRCRCLQPRASTCSLCSYNVRSFPHTHAARKAVECPVRWA